MELASPATMLACMAYARHRDTLALILTLAWIGHYLYRALVYPFLLARASHPMPLSVVIMSVVFNMVNAGTNGLWLFFLGTPRTGTISPLFVVGMVLFVTGFVMHVHADRVLRNLRSPGESGYKIPHGGLFEFVSCPNYLGELIEWSGWAMAAFSLPALGFALWTFANLVPRAITHHRWYREHFTDYPASRRALIPFIL
jgi:protein-S-isoprenylcysteine O-methyltransferase Ste14